MSAFNALTCDRMPLIWKKLNPFRKYGLGGPLYNFYVKLIVENIYDDSDFVISIVNHNIFFIFLTKKTLKKILITGS